MLSPRTVNRLVFVAVLGAGAAVLSPARASEEEVLLAKRREARSRDVSLSRGWKDATDAAHDDGRTGIPRAEGTAEGSSPLAVVDGDEETAWRGEAGASQWSLTLPFRRPFRLGLVRAVLGDSASVGVPLVYHWDVQRPTNGACGPDAAYERLRDGTRDDRQGNPFLQGPADVHALRQALFADEDACALRLVVDEMGAGGPPVVRELRVLEGAVSLSGTARLVVPEGGRTAVLSSQAAGLVDGAYRTLWAGEAGKGPWQLELVFPSSRLIDRVALTLGLDAVTVPDDDGTGRTYSGAYLPLRYRLETSADDDPAHYLLLDEAPGLPLRRRMIVDRGGRPVKRLRMTIDTATGPWGERDAALAAPVVRDLEVFASQDLRPVVRPPAFLVVDANPALLTHEMKGGEAYSDGLHARDLHARLRRFLAGVDDDTRWPADASRGRTVGAGRFVEVIEGDDPTLSPAFLAACSPPPTLVLSGAFDWEFDARTRRTPHRPGRVRWNVVAPPGDDGGMGALAAAVRQRVAPMVGFCGGAQILALLTSLHQRPEDVSEAEALAIMDDVLLRNDNTPIRGRLTRPDPYERTFWFDGPSLDGSRPVLRYDPHDPLFSLAPAGGPGLRRESREIPSSHGDMIRASAFSRGPLTGFRIVAESTFCRPWVQASGPEAVTVDPADASLRCVTVPQAFRSRDDERFPIMGFQFHPEQRDLQRLAPGSPPEARGDALNVLANAVDLALEGYIRAYWPTH